MTAAKNIFYYSHIIIFNYNSKTSNYYKGISYHRYEISKLTVIEINYYHWCSIIWRFFQYWTFTSQVNLWRTCIHIWNSYLLHNLLWFFFFFAKHFNVCLVHYNEYFWCEMRSRRKTLIILLKCPFSIELAYLHSNCWPLHPFHSLLLLWPSRTILWLTGK